jgi:hypothetical protein
MSYTNLVLEIEIPVASDRCAARCGHIRIMMYDMIPNVPTLWTYYNLMNNVNKVQKVNAGEKSTLIVLIQSPSKPRLLLIT